MKNANIAAKSQAMFLFLFLFHFLAALTLSTHAQASTYYPFPDTGQTKCYDNELEITCPSPGQDFYGQDAQYQPRLPRSYTKLGQGGTILTDDALHVDDGGQWIMTRDNVTGLIWEVKTNASKNDTYNWQNAKGVFIAGLNSSSFGGFSDWRLPDIKELSSLANAIGPPLFNAAWFPKNLSSGYWSSTGYPFPNDHRALRVDFNSSVVRCLYKLGSGHVRAVRAGPPPQQNLVDHGDGTVTDMATGLMWQNCSYGQTWNDGQCTGDAVTRTWQQALEAAENLNWAGYSDWRLPNRNELHSLVDYTQINMTIDPVFASVSSSYWSSTTNAYHPLDTHRAWLVNFRNGQVDLYSSKSASFYVRAVRAGKSKTGSLMEKAELIFAEAERLYPEWFFSGTGIRTSDRYEHLMIYQEYPERNIFLLTYDGVVYYHFQGRYHYWFTVEEWLKYLGY
ncbi:DUF1566 domain-containing protein [Desulfonatronovibrio magnus]|uniref:Lcl C-terminal domain-containing protein n=1 Tax=Desulfonatronovibrio magnus TaxID=698827 RepID=UPI0005EB1D4A|nr:DUF1566 domain-containing protein [Desulfonatronovibrio magnus]